MLIRILCILLAVYHGGANNFEICKVNDYEVQLEKGGQGNITTKGWPENFEGPEWNKQSCTLGLISCAQCRIELKLEELILPQCIISDDVTDGCIPNCDYIQIYEPYYKRFTLRTLVDGSNHTRFLSISNALKIKFCDNILTQNKAQKKFRFSYEVLEKVFHYPGNNALKSGVVMAPNFPHGYSRNDEGYIYFIQAPEKQRVLLDFPDWDLAPASVFHIYDWEIHRVIAKYTSTTTRPAIIQSQHHEVKMSFSPKKDEYFRDVNYIGFKVTYTFTDKSYKEKFWTGCGQFHRGKQQLQIKDPQCTDEHDWMDCVWVVTKSSSYDALSLSVYLQKSFSGILQVRSGNYSESELVFSVSSTSKTVERQLFSKDAFYIRLKYQCQKDQGLFEARLVSYVNASQTISKTCPPQHFRCSDQPMCLSENFKCDKILHCFDSSDELNCQPIEASTAIIPTHNAPCSTQYSCDNGRYSFCLSQICDGIFHCKDGTDERMCLQTPAVNHNPKNVGSHSVSWSIYIPIGLACVTAAIVVCMVVSFCTRRKHLLRRRQQLNAQRNMAVPYQFNDPRNGSSIYNVEGDYIRDAPPTYEEALNQSSPYMFNNMGFSASGDPAAQLPPYMPTSDNNTIPPPQPGQRHQSPLRPYQPPVQINTNSAPVQNTNTTRANPQQIFSRDRSVNNNSSTQGVDNPTFESDIPNTGVRSIVGMADIGIRFSDLQDDIPSNTYRTAVSSSQYMSNCNSDRSSAKTEENRQPKPAPKVSVESGGNKDDNKPSESRNSQSIGTTEAATNFVSEDSTATPNIPQESSSSFV